MEICNLQNGSKELIDCGHFICFNTEKKVQFAIADMILE